MKRRDFLVASGTGISSLSYAVSGMAQGQKNDRQLLELRLYRMLPGDKKKVLSEFLANALIPACSRLGVGPIGVFEPVHGVDSLTLYVLLPHKSLESVMTAPARLETDAEFQKAAESFYKLPSSDPPYMRVESSLMLAFEQAPRVEVPSSVAGKSGRIFEMRIYESHCEKAARRKIEMFNSGGELAIFRKTGLHPVFFGETLIGPRIPNLTYMLAFPDWAAREKAWAAFREDPAWKKLSAEPYYADTVSNITDLILRPTSYSQV
ncbi:MAG TPA: NIPSNAP family protein [Acidobacteriota bacterium]|nr:NIPSNAP family protein [Acidobacteriota bacterium]